MGRGNGRCASGVPDVVEDDRIARLVKRSERLEAARHQILSG